MQVYVRQGDLREFANAHAGVEQHFQGEQAGGVVELAAAEGVFGEFFQFAGAADAECAARRRQQGAQFVGGQAARQALGQLDGGFEFVEGVVGEQFFAFQPVEHGFQAGHAPFDAGFLELFLVEQVGEVVAQQVAVAIADGGFRRAKAGEFL